MSNFKVVSGGTTYDFDDLYQELGAPFSQGTAVGFKDNTGNDISSKYLRQDQYETLVPWRVATNPISSGYKSGANDLSSIYQCKNAWGNTKQDSDNSSYYYDYGDGRYRESLKYGGVVILEDAIRTGRVGTIVYTHGTYGLFINYTISGSVYQINVNSAGGAGTICKRNF